MYNSLPELSFSEFWIELQLQNESPYIKTDFIGAAVRGTIMNRAKNLLCANKKSFNDCSTCLLVQKCPYAQLFETKQREDSEIMKKYHDIPHPFTMVPLLKGNTLTIRIVLFGEFIDYFPYFFYVIKSMEGPKHYTIKSIRNFEKEILDGEKIRRLPIIHTIKNAVLQSISENTVQIGLEFITPLRIKKKGKLLNPTTFDSKALITNILRRLFLISYFYGNNKWEPDYKEIIKYSSNIKITKNNLKWLELERYSTRSKNYIPMGGIVAGVQLSKEAGHILPLLVAGSLVQIGKNTSFGHGFYKINFN